MLSHALHKISLLFQNQSNEMLTYAFKITMQLLQNRKFRTVVLRTLVRLYLSLQVPDFISVCQVKKKRYIFPFGNSFSGRVVLNLFG